MEINKRVLQNTLYTINIICMVVGLCMFTTALVFNLNGASNWLSTKEIIQEFAFFKSLLNNAMFVGVSLFLSALVGSFAVARDLLYVLMSYSVMHIILAIVQAIKLTIMLVTEENTITGINDVFESLSCGGELSSVQDSMKCCSLLINNCTYSDPLTDSCEQQLKTTTYHMHCGAAVIFSIIIVIRIFAAGVALWLRRFQSTKERAQEGA